MRAQAVSGRYVCEQGRLPRAPGLTVAGVTQAPIAQRAPGSIPQRIPQRILVHEVEVCQVMRRPGRAVGGAEPERGDLFWASPWNRRVRLWLGVRRRFSISSAVFEVTASKFPAGSFRQGGAGGRQPHRTPESWLASTSLQAFETGTQNRGGRATTTSRPPRRATQRPDRATASHHANRQHARRRSHHARHAHAATASHSNRPDQPHHHQNATSRRPSHEPPTKPRGQGRTRRSQAGHGGRGDGTRATP